MRSIDEPRFIDDVSVRVRIRRNRGWPSASGLLTSATVLVSLVSAKPAFAERVASTPAAARPAAAEPTAKVGGISEGGRACVPSRMTNSFRSRSCHASRRDVAKSVNLDKNRLGVLKSHTGGRVSCSFIIQSLRTYIYTVTYFIRA